MTIVEIANEILNNPDYALQLNAENKKGKIVWSCVISGRLPWSCRHTILIDVESHDSPDAAMKVAYQDWKLLRGDEDG